MKKIEKYIYIVLIVILVGVIASGTTYIIMRDKDKTDIKENDSKPNNNENKPQEEVITLSERELNEYLSYVPFLNATLILDDEKEFYEDAYNGKNNTILNINNEIVLYNTFLNSKKYARYEGPEFTNLEICANKPCKLDEYYKESDINKVLSKMYNKQNISIKDDYISIPEGALFYQNSYYGKYMGGGADPYYKINKEVKGNKTEQTIIIEEEALFIKHIYPNDKDCLNIYANTYDMKHSLNNLNKNYIDYISDDRIEELNLNNYKFTKFKHTFKKNNTGYYWYSTEVVK